MVNKQEHTPLMDALMAYEKDQPISFHVPGHKGGSIFHEKGKGVFQQFLRIDATEVEGLDDLHTPEDAILQAEQLLSELYGTQKSYFLVNGTTCGNLAMILGNCAEGDIVLVQRNCHKSILNGLKLAKVKPVFLRNEINDEWAVAEGLSVEIVKKALKQYAEVKALILTYPTYYGVANELEEIIAVAHEHKVKVLVDEAHGAHFIVGDPFPKSSLQCGADFVVHSAHKTLPAMTMGSYLHVNHTISDYKRVEMYLRMLQSSSPSYPIMASLDLARSFLGTFTKRDAQYTLEKISAFKEALASIEGIKVLRQESTPIDPLKITLQTDGTFSGVQLQEKLVDFRVYSEMADPRNILLILPLLKKGQNYPFKEAVSIIKKAVAYLKDTHKALKSIHIDKEIGDISELQLSFTEMETRNKLVWPMHHSVGCIAAETIVPYPPGVPYLIDGEEITASKMAYLQHMIDIGIRFQGGTYLNDQSILIYE